MANVDGPNPAIIYDSKLEKIPDKPEPQDFDPPVAWLFGRQLIANLKYIMLYTAFKGKLDPRDWMKAEVIPGENASRAEIDKFWKDWNETWDDAQEANPDSQKEFWFDYISDTGDGQRAVYSVAYLCMSDLAASKNPQLGETPEFVLQPDRAKLEAQGKMLLPRGTFLFVGGDTSYHVSDYATLSRRFQNPFWWAYNDLKNKAKSLSVVLKVPRLLIGIPGNHDYYDSLDGFNRQFRRPATGDEVPAGKRPPLLRIPTFSRRQDASFLALRLPFDWWFWGMDTEAGEIDFRQLEFFNNLQATYAPRKLIVATPEPTTVFGKLAGDDENQSKTFKALGLERPFLKDGEQLEDGKCRLDLSGDVHHYARYWGPPPATGESSNYASVVAGGGGAFFHPTHTDAREVRPQVLYPKTKASRNEVADQLFKFRNIWNGGYIWLFGALIAFALFFSAVFPQSTRDATDSFPPWVNLGVSPPITAQSPEPLPAYVKSMPRYTWGPNRTLSFWRIFPWMLSLAASLVALGAALLYSVKLFKTEYNPERRKTEYYPEGRLPEQKMPEPKQDEKDEVPLKKRLIAWLLVAISFACLAFGLWGFWTVEPELTRYARSLLILTSFVWALLAIIESVKYSEWLFKQAYKVNIESWHYWPIWLLMILAVCGVGFSLWVFGKHESAFLVSDIVQLFILAGGGIGLVYFAYGTGGGLQKGAGKIGFLLLGASHAVLQLAVPFLLIRKGHLLLAPLAMLIIAIVFKFVGRALAKLDSGWPLAIAWIVFGAALLAIPFLIPSTISFVLRPSTLNMPVERLDRFLLCFYAAAVGAVMSCVLFGGYLAVALGFNGHNNEAGGAARIEGFKQLIRFRINRRGLTGYVIGIDKPRTEGEKLRPEIVDVFHICDEQTERRA